MSALDELHDEIAACTKCTLAKSRLKTVPGEGPSTAKVMFIGEAPGWHENQQGRPFVGPAGQFLEELLHSVGLKRDDVFITNVVKCRPPQNRDPLPTEIGACDPYLARQIALIRPRIVVTLGRYSMAKFFPGESIGKIHGVPRRRNGVIYFPMYHPAAALHQPTLRKVIEADMLKLLPLLAEGDDEPAASAPHRPEAPSASPSPESGPEQLRLF